MKMMGLLLSVIAGVVLLSSFAIAAEYGGGSGTAESPFQIADVDDLLELAETVADYDKCFILTGNIDLSDRTFSKAVIAQDTVVNEAGFQGTAFTGIFDGNDHTISNLTINASGRDDGSLFGCIGAGGQVKKLRLVHTVTQGRYGNAGIVSINYGTVSQCRTEGFIHTAHANIGAICGTNFSGTISFCYAAADGTIWGEAGNAGGICGYNTGTISRCYAECPVSSNTIYAVYTGGLCGYAGGTFIQCFARGPVAGKDYVGGFCGYLHGSTVNQCYACGSVTGQNCIGGFCGMFSYSNMNQCYAVGPVSGVSNVGGLSGQRTMGLDYSSFWDTQTCNQLTSVCGTGKTTAEMMMLATFTDAGWDFSNSDGDPADWIILHEGKDYPRLAWQTIIPGDIAGLYGVNLADFAELSRNWLETGCPADCEDADIDSSGSVDTNDLVLLVEYWLKGE